MALQLDFHTYASTYSLFCKYSSFGSKDKKNNFPHNMSTIVLEYYQALPQLSSLSPSLSLCVCNTCIIRRLSNVNW